MFALLPSQGSLVLAPITMHYVSVTSPRRAPLHPGTIPAGPGAHGARAHALPTAAASSRSSSSSISRCTSAENPLRAALTKSAKRFSWRSS